MNNLDQLIISQYASDPVTIALIERWGQAINPDFLFDQFFNYIWNALAGNWTGFIDPNSTEGYGLDVWGRIVGIGRVITASSSDYLGFKGPSGQSGTTFNFGVFYRFNGALFTNFTLTNQAYLLLIMAKAAANITDGSIPAVNQILLNLFPNRGICYVRDNQNMTMTYVFTFSLQPFEKAIVRNSGVLPTPSGVKALYSFVN